ncbi:MAG: histidine phosphatase family protein [Verrucomicrobiota bacterium]|nr:histidine phosphatase family protein [Verrucomicrobiota bacterium]
MGKVYVGRTPGIHLDDQGRQQAEVLAERLAQKPIHKIFSSPLERCQETAAPLAKRFNLEIQIADALTEIDFGDWTNKTPQELAPLEKWRQWTSFRSGCVPLDLFRRIEITPAAVSIISISDQGPKILGVNECLA